MVPIYGKLSDLYGRKILLLWGIVVFLIFGELREWTGGSSGLPGVPGLTVGGYVLAGDVAYYCSIHPFMRLRRPVWASMPSRPTGAATARSVAAPSAVATLTGVDFFTSDP